MTAAEQHRREVVQGERFEFGANWARYLKVLNDDRIRLAENSLKSMLKEERLDGRTFLDIGSGSGLFSLAARRLGAKVHSFDYDPQSVACTRELKRRYVTNDTQWTIEQGSVLDRDFLARLGTFDIVYSWGVLHHTGQMWSALDNVKPLVKMDGKLFIAIYNDLGAVTDRWANVKRRYNALARPLALGFALTVIAREEAKSLRGYLRNGGFGAWRRSWTDYDKESTRGMSKWHDWIDWIGGHPYERATVEDIVDHYAKDGFSLFNLVDRSHGYGCNEFVFRRVAPLGTLVDSPIPGGTSLVRRFGRRIIGPFERTSEGWTGTLKQRPVPPSGNTTYLFTDDCLSGPARFVGDARVIVAPAAADQAAVLAAAHFVVCGRLQEPVHPFQHLRGKMWSWELPELEPLADDKTDNKSPVYLLEDGRQLPYPHTIHDAIAQLGNGRFSHWGKWLCFAPLANDDPNQRRDQLRAFVAVAPGEV